MPRAIRGSGSWVWGPRAPRCHGAALVEQPPSPPQAPHPQPGPPIPLARLGCERVPRAQRYLPAVRVPEREADVLADADVVVAGGGPAGLGAAVAAARAGARVVLCERYGFLGGNLTVAKVGTICGLYVGGDGGEFDFVVGGIARELAQALARDGAGVGPVPFKETAVFLYVPWAVKRLADHLVTEEDTLEVLLHSLVADVVVDDSMVRALVLATKRGPRAVTGKVFVDCTGDADV